MERQLTSKRLTSHTTGSRGKGVQKSKAGIGALDFLRGFEMGTLSCGSKGSINKVADAPMHLGPSVFLERSQPDGT